MGIMGLWFLDFLLEHLSLFGKGTPQRQVPFGSTGGRVHECVSACACVWDETAAAEAVITQTDGVSDRQYLL